VWEGECGGNSSHVYKNEKLRPVETIPGMGGEGIKENDRGGEFN
jgi:hypothetical protein